MPDRARSMRLYIKHYYQETWQCIMCICLCLFLSFINADASFSPYFVLNSISYLLCFWMYIFFLVFWLSITLNDDHDFKLRRKKKSCIEFKCSCCVQMCECIRQKKSRKKTTIQFSEHAMNLRCLKLQLKRMQSSSSNDYVR